MNVLEENILDISRNHYHYLLSLKNVKGVGLGYKTINGCLTNELCIHVLVEEKVDNKYLTRNNIIPKIYMGIKTDVFNTGKIKAFEGSPITKRFRPLQGGCVISVSDSDEDGTLGYIVQRGVLKKDYFILSNNHVLSELEKYPIGSEILQPSKFYGATTKDVVAYLSEVIPIKLKKGIKEPVNFVDCAIAKITDKKLLSKMIFKIGVIKGVNKAVLKEEIRKTGYVTGLTNGIVRTIGATREIDFESNKTALFKEQILIDATAKHGDSGAVIINKNNEVIGLLMGGSEETGVTIVNDINLVLKQLNVSIYK